MKVGASGYEFECKLDSYNQVGVISSFKSVVVGDKRHMILRHGVDSYGKLVCPVDWNSSLGFRQILGSAEDFVRSRRGYYSKLGDFVVLADGVLVFDESGELVSDKGLGLYIPQTVKNGVLYCKMCSDSVEQFRFSMKKEVVEAYRHGIIEYVRDVDTKFKFLKNLIEVVS